MAPFGKSFSGRELSPDSDLTAQRRQTQGRPYPFPAFGHQGNLSFFRRMYCTWLFFVDVDIESKIPSILPSDDGYLCFPVVSGFQPMGHAMLQRPFRSQLQEYHEIQPDILPESVTWFFLAPLP
jgi:hypothetical protein